MHFYIFFLLLWIIFVLLDPDPDPLTRLNPERWFVHKGTHIFVWPAEFVHKEAHIFVWTAEFVHKGTHSLATEGKNKDDSS
jgi:hypothetical protein